MTLAFDAGTATSGSNVHTGAFHRGKIRVVGHTHPNWQDTYSRLEELVRLPHGWDGYRGEPVSLQNATFALKVLETICPPDVDGPPLHIVPGPSGDLQLEWGIGNSQIELHILKPNQAQAWRVAPTIDDDGEELSLSTDFTQVAHWLRELSERVNAANTAAA